MKQTHTSYRQYDNIDELVYLASSAHLLEEKTRINLYLPKAVVKIMDSIAKNQSRSELVKNLVVEKAKKTQPAKTKAEPGLYGMFSNAAEEFHDIDKEVKKMWSKSLAKLDRQIQGKFD